MTLYIGGKSCDNQNDLNDLFSIVEKLPFQDCLYSRPLYIDFNKFYIINNNDIYEHNLNCGEPKKVELQDNILLIAEDSQHKEKKAICIDKNTEKSSILDFLSKFSENIVKVTMIGDSNTKGPCADRNANVLKILDVLTHYQRCDIAINNFRIYNNVNNQRLIKVDRDSLDSEELLEMKESKILSKKPFIYGGSTALAFLVVAAALHFSSSKPAVQMVVLVFTAASIFSGLTVGLVTYYYIRPNQKLENMGISESAQEQQFVRQL